MAATTRKRKSACLSAKSKKAKAAKAEGANDRAAEADAKAGALEGGGSTPHSPPPPMPGLPLSLPSGLMT